MVLSSHSDIMVVGSVLLDDGVTGTRRNICIVVRVGCLVDCEVLKAESARRVGAVDDIEA